MDGHSSFRKEGGQNPAYRSTHHPPNYLKGGDVLHLPYSKLPLAEPGTPDLRSPSRYLAWLARNQLRSLALPAFFGITWMLSQALLWAAVGAAIDHGISGHSQEQLWK